MSGPRDRRRRIVNEERRVYLIRRAVEMELGVVPDADRAPGKAVERIIRIARAHVKRTDRPVAEWSQMEREIERLHSALDRVKEEARTLGFAQGWDAMHHQAVCAVGMIGQELDARARGRKP